MNTYNLLKTAAGCALVILGGCASTPKYNAEMAVAESAVDRANTSSTSENAAGELQLANSKLARARDAYERKDYEQARQLAEQAEVDAEVAELTAQSERSRLAAKESLEAARVLRQEISRNPSR